MYSIEIEVDESAMERVRKQLSRYLIKWNFRDTLISRIDGSHIFAVLKFAFFI